MHGLRVKGRNEKHNLLVLEQAVNSANYSHWLGLGDFTPDDNQKTIAASTNHKTSVHFGGWVLSATGQASGIVAYFRRPREWRSGLCRLRIHFSCSTNTGNWYRGLYVTPIDTGDAMPNPTFIYDAIAVPGTAYDMEVDALEAADVYFPIDSGYSGILVHVVRDDGHASDTCAGEIIIHGVEVVYKEDSRDAGFIVSTTVRGD